MRKRLTIGLVSVVVLFALGFGSWWWLEIRPVSLVEHKVRAVLNDPDSAKFRDVGFNKKTGAGCGYVNAKNRMGGYTGFTMFIVYADERVEFSPEQASPGSTTLEKLTAANNVVEYLQRGIENCHEQMR
jgi:hypothetical protein